MTQKKSKSEVEEVPFEQMLKDLESLVLKLERGDLSLEDSLKYYEQGVGLAKHAQDRLTKMEGKIEELTKTGDLKPFESASTDVP